MNTQEKLTFLKNKVQRVERNMNELKSLKNINQSLDFENSVNQKMKNLGKRFKVFEFENAITSEDL